MAALVFSNTLCRGLYNAVVRGSTSSSVLCSNPLSRGGGVTIRHKSSSVQFASRPELPPLAYRKLKGKSPGVLFLPAYTSNMNGRKAEALEEFCRSAGHSYLRFDYTGHGASEGAPAPTLGALKKDVLFAMDELTEPGEPQILVGSSMGGWLALLAAVARPKRTASLVGVGMAADHPVTVFNALPLETRRQCEEKGEWTLATNGHQEEGAKGPAVVGRFSMEFLREAESHCVLQGPIPVHCPVRLIHGLRDRDVPWHVSLQVAERILSDDVDVILRRHGEHRMGDQDDIQLLVRTVEDLIDMLIANQIHA